MGTIDNALLLCTNQGAITADAASTDLLDLGAGNSDKGPGRAAFLRVTVTTTSTGAGTIAFCVQSCATVGGTYVTNIASTHFVGTTLVKGRVIMVPMPEEHERFVRGYFEITGTVAAGKYTMDLTA